MTDRRPSLLSLIRTFERSGKTVNGMRIHPDGTVDLLTEAPDLSACANDAESDWVNLAGTSQVSGPSRA